MTKIGWLAVLGCATLATCLAPPGLARASGPAGVTALTLPNAGEPEPLTLLASAENAWARQPAPIPQTRKIAIRRMRPNTISLGFQGGYGIARGNSRISDGFGGGLGYAFRFRYLLEPSFALGFSFENHNLRDRNIVNPRPNPDVADSHLVMTTVAAEGIFYINREQEAHPYLLAGFGFASPNIIYTPSSGVPVEETRRVNEGAFLVAGVGLERFVRERFSLDIAARGYGLVSNSELTTFLQVTAGIHLYPGD